MLPTVCGLGSVHTLLRRRSSNNGAFPGDPEGTWQAWGTEELSVAVKGKPGYLNSKVLAIIIQIPKYKDSL